jgi:hypothetical protein
MTRGHSELHELDDVNICANLCSDVRDNSALIVGLHRPGFGTGGIPPSRFADETKFGIFYYVPYTSGQQLLLSLELAYNLALAIWDRFSEVACYAHLNNKLMEMGYFKGFNRPWWVVNLRFGEEVFGPEGYATSNFSDAFLSTHLSERSQPVPEGYVTKQAEGTTMAEGKVDYQLLLTLVKQDLHSHVCGDVPILGVDHMLAIGTAYKFFNQFKPQADESGAPEWISRLGPKYQTLCRSLLLPSLLDEIDEEACRGMAEHMWNKAAADRVTYWGANKSTKDRMKRGLHHTKEASRCIVM